MSSTPIQRAIGTVKDRTRIGIVKVTSHNAPKLKVLIVKATSHDADSMNEKYVNEILNLTSYKRRYINACTVNVSKRLGKTRNWVVALKCLIVIHRLLSEGDPAFQHEILLATRKGARLLNLADFRDETHSNSWDHSAFVRTYALYLDQKLDFLIHDRRQGGNGGNFNRFDRFDRRQSYGGYDHFERSGHDRFVRRQSYGGYDHFDEFEARTSSYDLRPSFSGEDQSERRPSGNKPDEGHEDYGEYDPWKRTPPPPPPQHMSTPLREMKIERILGRMNQLQKLLDRLLACKPTGFAKRCRLVHAGLYPIVKESFKLYGDVCDVLSVLLDRFFDMEYPISVKTFDVYVTVGRQIDELIDFHNWCKETGVGNSAEYPEVQRITNRLLETLEEFLNDKWKKPKIPQRTKEEEEEEEIIAVKEVILEVKALPTHPPEGKNDIVVSKFEPKKEEKKHQLETNDFLDVTDNIMSSQDHAKTLALALFEGFRPSLEVNSVWDIPNKADWEMALVESVSNLSRQKTAFAGGFDSLLLNGMYDQGVIKQHMLVTQSNGSASSVAVQGLGKPPLALPAPNGYCQDPFAASLSVPPPSYVQMADMEKKQKLVVQEQRGWEQYVRDGMQGQMSLSKINGGECYLHDQYSSMSYVMQPINGVRRGGYYY